VKYFAHLNMFKFLSDWVGEIEESDAKLRAQGYTVIHGAGISYLTTLNQPEASGGEKSRTDSTKSLRLTKLRLSQVGLSNLSVQIQVLKNLSLRLSSCFPDERAH
jgi:hypothetical protein